MGHVLPECVALLLSGRKVVQPDNELIPGEIRGVEFVPVRGRCEFEMIA
jgi:hypothetical protein